MGNIPPEAKRVFKGVIFDVFQWEQEMYDGSKATFEAIKRKGTIQIIPTIDEQVLLSYEEQPTKSRTYTCLGGRQEEGEEPLLTAQRELLEEAGLESDDWELFKLYETPGKIDWKSYFYVARNCRKVAEPNLDAGEKIDVIPVSFDGFIKHVIDPEFWGNKDFVIDVLRMKDDPVRLDEFKRKLFG